MRPVSNDGTIFLYHLSYPPGHRHDQLLQVVTIVHPGHPQLNNLVLPHPYVGAGSVP